MLSPAGQCGVNETITCSPCPQHFNESCPADLQNAALNPGWWRPDSQSKAAFRCRPPSRCSGSGRPGDGGCAPHSGLYGILCEVCPSMTYYSRGLDACTACTSSDEVHQTVLLSLIILTVLLLPLFLCVVRTSSGKDRRKNSCRKELQQLTIPAWAARVIHYLHGHVLRKVRTVVKGMSVNNVLVFSQFT